MKMIPTLRSLNPIEVVNRVKSGLSNTSLVSEPLRWSESLVLNVLSRVEVGDLEIRTPDGQIFRYGNGSKPTTVLHIENRNCWMRMLLYGGSVRFFGCLVIMYRT